MSAPHPNLSTVNADMDKLTAMGYDRKQAEYALAQTHGDPERAIDLLEVGNYSDSSHRERMDGEPGVVVSEEHPDIGPILTILLCSMPAQHALNQELEERLTWTRDWNSANPSGPTQSVLAELMKLCAHVHMNSGAARADAALLIRSLENHEFSDLDEFLQGLQPLAETIAHKVDQQTEYSIAVENIMGKFTAQLDSHLTGKSVQFGDLVIVQADTRGPVQIEEHWYPQRCTNELAEISSLYRHVKTDMECALQDIRRKRLELRSFKGVDVVEMLECAAETVSKYAGDEPALQLHQLSQVLGHQRNDLMDQQQDIDSDLKALRNAYNVFDDLLFTALKHEPVKVERYRLVGLMLSAQEYYTRYQDSWFYVYDDSPSQCQFQTVRDAGRDASTILAVYSIEMSTAPLEPSQTIKDFCLEEVDAMETSTQEATASESDSDSEMEPELKPEPELELEPKLEPEAEVEIEQLDGKSHSPSPQIE